MTNIAISGNILLSEMILCCAKGDSLSFRRLSCELPKSHFEPIFDEEMVALFVSSVTIPYRIENLSLLVE